MTFEKGRWGRMLGALPGQQGEQCKSEALVVGVSDREGPVNKEEAEPWSRKPRSSTLGVEERSNALVES